MKPILNLTFLLFFLFSINTNAQLANGSTAPNWTLTDINGETHTLYDYLDDGKTVFIDFFATWCGPCWNYHNSGNMEELYEIYGPDGTDEIVVIGLEGDANTTLADLYGTGSNTIGDWVTGTVYPIIEGQSITSDYQIAYWPTIYGICSDKKITEVGQASTTALYNFAQACPQPGVQIDVTSIISVNCHGGNTGEIAINATGWPAPFTYNWNNGATTATVSNLTAGAYRCTVTNDAGHSEVTEMITIEEPVSALAVEVLSTETPDCLGNMGSISVNALGGGGDYSYEWSNGASGRDVSGLSAGFYTVSVSDGLNCTTVLQSIEVESPEAPTAIVAPVADLSCDTPLLLLDGTASTQGDNISYFWSTDVGNIVSGEDSNVAEVDAAGSYFFNVFNENNGCLGYREVQVQGNNIAPEANVVITGVSSVGATDGSAICDPTGGVEPYTYAWNTGEITAEITDLAPDTYTVSITDANNCERIEDVLIETFGCELDAEILSINVNCAGAEDGFVIVNILAGTPPFNFLWSNGETLDNIVVGPGEYSVTITDGDACEMILNATVTEPSGLTLEVTSTDETAADANDGTATATVAGGTMPYTFTWSNGSSTAAIENLAIGTYTLTVTDANECTETATVIINAFDCQLTANMLVIPANCNGVEDGFAILEIVEGTAPFNFLWSNGETLDNIVATAGEYTLTVTDGNNCDFVFEAVVTEPAELVVDVTVTSESSSEASDGTASATATGGVSPYTFQWSNGGVASTITNLSPGEYCVTVTDANACETISCATVNAFECSLDANVLVVPASCFGMEDGFAIIEVVAGTPPFNFLWSNGETLDNIVATAGEYTVTISDGDNCEFVLTANVTQPDELIADASSTDETADDTNDGTATANPTGGTPPYSFAWSNDSTSATIDNLMPGIYEVTVTDANDCTASESVTVFSFSCDILITGTVQDISCANVCDGSISVTASGGIPPYTYAWSEGELMGNTIEGLCAGEYTVTVTDVTGCEATLALAVTEPALLILTVATATILDCPESTDGSATVLAAGGTEPYTYVWSNENIGTVADGLGVGTYSITVTDANGCVATAGFDIFSEDLEAPTVITQNISVFLDEGGFIIIAPTDVDNGSTDNCEIETYSLDNDTFNCENIGDNEVMLTVTDFSGNTTSATAIIIVADTIAPTVICPEDIEILSCEDTVVEYNLPVVLDNCNVGAPTLIEGLASGSVFPVGTTTVVYGFEDVTCSFTVTIAVPELPIIAVETQSVTCTGGVDGAISVTVTGSSSYTFEWDTGETTADIDGLVAGTYTLTVTDENGCETIIVAEIFEPDPIADAIIVTEIIHESNNQHNGAVDVTISNLITNPTFVWMLNGEIIATTEDLENVAAGEYTLEVTAENGCIFNSETIIVDNITGVNAPTVDAGFTLSPNPTSGLVYIKIDHDFSVAATVQFWGVLGKQLLLKKAIKAGQKEMQLNLTNFPSGTYFVQLNTEKGTFIRKVVR